MVSQSGCLIPGLPNEVAVICLAKIPLLYRHRIGAVCRRWRNLFSEEYYWAVRRERSACETLLLMYTKNYYKTGAWYGLYPALDAWIRLHLMPADDRETGSYTFAAVDKKLFAIGGSILSEDRPSPAGSSKVTYFDLKTWEWRETAPMHIGRYGLMAGAMNGLLYVFGGRTVESDHEQTWIVTAEVYDPVAATWKFVSSMPLPINLHSSVVVDGKFYAVNTLPNAGHHAFWELKGVVYSPREDRWNQMAQGLDSEWRNHSLEFNGLICISRECMFGKERYILGYDPNEEKSKLIHGQSVIENAFHRIRGPVPGIEFGKLLNLDGRLCYIIRRKSGNAISFKIEDLTRGCVASKSFCGRVLTGCEDDSHLADSEEDLDDRVVVEREVVRL